MQEKTGIARTDQDSQLRSLLSAAIKRSPLKREVIAEELTNRLGIRVTLAMLNDYTATNRKAVRFPLLFSAALCEVLDDDSIGLFGVRPRIRRLVEFAEAELQGIRSMRDLDALRESLLQEKHTSALARKSAARQTQLPLREPD